MVSTIDPLATRAGVDAMAAGGNAVDAAIAANSVLAVTAQHMCGLGGDLFALVHTGTGPPACLNASGRAGSGADPAGLLAEGFTSMPHRDDVRSVPVPGCIDGWWALHQRFGSLPMADLLAPAIRLATDGFAASALLAHAAGRIRDVHGAQDFAGLTGPGSLVTRPGVAAVLRSLAEGGRDGVYLGAFGEELLAVGDGEYTPSDLDMPGADWVDPLGLEIWGHRVWTVPPNSQGYLALAAARIAEGLDLPGEEDPLRAHLLVGRPAWPATIARTSCTSTPMAGRYWTTPASGRAVRPSGGTPLPRWGMSGGTATPHTCAPLTATAWACR
jgi:gamma-glutamyltranspeptidase/glutathione hydrolase